MNMGAEIAIFVALFVGISVACALLILSVTQSKAARENARERRMAEHRMNARLLRLDI
jgi:heme exporter protein D